MSGVYVRLVFKGRNLERAIAKLQRNNIDMFKLKAAADELVFYAQAKDEVKIFAIFEGSCYNIKRLGYSGGLYPLYYLKKNLGVLAGLVVFLAMLIISNSFVYRIEINGSGSLYSGEILEILKAENIGVFSAFSGLDFKSVEKSVLKLDGIEFVSVSRRGASLILDVRLSAASLGQSQKNYADMRAQASGEVLSVTVLRGTALVAAGDTVEKGQSLIGAYMVGLDEEKIPTFVIGRVELKCNAKILFESEYFDDNARSNALIYAKTVLGGKEIIEHSFSQIGEGGKTYIEIDCYYIENITEALAG